MHYHKIKMTAAAMAMAVLVTGNMPAAELNTATVSAKSAISAVLPAAAWKHIVSQPEEWQQASAGQLQPT